VTDYIGAVITSHLLEVVASEDNIHLVPTDVSVFANFPLACTYIGVNGESSLTSAVDTKDPPLKFTI